MEWLTNLLGMGGPTSSFGALASGPGAGGAAPGLGAAQGAFGAFNPTNPAQTNGMAAANGAPPPGGGGMQLPGIWGKMLGQQGGGAAAPGGASAGGGNNFALQQAMSLLKPAPMAAPQMMKLLSGPGAGGM